MYFKVKWHTDEITTEPSEFLDGSLPLVNKHLQQKLGPKEFKEEKEKLWYIKLRRASEKLKENRKRKPKNSNDENENENDADNEVDDDSKDTKKKEKSSKSEQKGSKNKTKKKRRRKKKNDSDTEDENEDVVLEEGERLIGCF